MNKGIFTMQKPLVSNDIYIDKFPAFQKDLKSIIKKLETNMSITFFLVFLKYIFNIETVQKLFNLLNISVVNIKFY